MAAGPVVGINTQDIDHVVTGEPACGRSAVRFGHVKAPRRHDPSPLHVIDALGFEDLMESAPGIDVVLGIPVRGVLQDFRLVVERKHDVGVEALHVGCPGDHLLVLIRAGLSIGDSAPRDEAAVGILPPHREDHRPARPCHLLMELIWLSVPALEHADHVELSAECVLHGDQSAWRFPPGCIPNKIFRSAGASAQLLRAWVVVASSSVQAWAVWVAGWFWYAGKESRQAGAGVVSASGSPGLMRKMVALSLAVATMVAEAAGVAVETRVLPGVGWMLPVRPPAVGSSGLVMVMLVMVVEP